MVVHFARANENNAAASIAFATPLEHRTLSGGDRVAKTLPHPSTRGAAAIGNNSATTYGRPRLVRRPSPSFSDASYRLHPMREATTAVTAVTSSSARPWTARRSEVTSSRGSRVRLSSCRLHGIARCRLRATPDGRVFETDDEPTEVTDAETMQLSSRFLRCD